MNPPGQKTRDDFPRFGLPPYAQRFPSDVDERLLVVEINGGEKIAVDVGLSDLTRSSVQSDFQHPANTASIFIG